MAALRLPEPGSKHGPCSNACDHTDCNLTHKQAISLCAICGAPIGYGVRFYKHGNSAHGLTHARCEELEAQRGAQGETPDRVYPGTEEDFAKDTLRNYRGGGK